MYIYIYIYMTTSIYLLIEMGLKWESITVVLKIHFGEMQNSGWAWLGYDRVREGSAWLGLARPGSAWLSSARLGSARPGSAQLGAWRGSARLGLARPGSARLSSARLSSVSDFGR